MNFLISMEVGVTQHRTHAKPSINDIIRKTWCWIIGQNSQVDIFMCQHNTTWRRQNCWRAQWLLIGDVNHNTRKRNLFCSLDTRHQRVPPYVASKWYLPPSKNQELLSFDNFRSIKCKCNLKQWISSTCRGNISSHCFPLFLDQRWWENETA